MSAIKCVQKSDLHTVDMVSGLTFHSDKFIDIPACVASKMWSLHIDRGTANLMPYCI